MPPAAGGWRGGAAAARCNVEMSNILVLFIIMVINPRPTGGRGYFEPPSRFLAISSTPMQVSPPNLQYPPSQQFYTFC